MIDAAQVTCCTQAARYSEKTRHSHHYLEKARLKEKESSQTEEGYSKASGKPESKINTQQTWQNGFLPPPPLPPTSHLPAGAHSILRAYVSAQRKNMDFGGRSQLKSQWMMTLNNSGI